MCWSVGSLAARSPISHEIPYSDWVSSELVARAGKPYQKACANGTWQVDDGLIGAVFVGVACLALLSCSGEQQSRGDMPKREAQETSQADGRSPSLPQAATVPATAMVAGKTIQAPAIPDACRYDGLTEALTAAKARWQGTGINTYSMTIQRSSFHQLSAWPNSTPLKLTVRSGQPTGNLKRVDSGWLQSVTVDGLFGYIENEASKKPDCLKVEFDPMLGYPTSIRIDPVFGGTDDEVEFSVTEFGP